MKFEHISGTPYRENELLTPAELESVSHYKDCANRQYKWDYKPKHGEKSPNIEIDCHMINGTLRNQIDRNKLSYPDRFRVDYLTKDINYAIMKNKAPCTFNVIKGLTDANFLKNKHAGEILVDEAFGSYTTNVEVAKSYTNKNNPVFLIQTIYKDTPVMHIDDEEDEWLLPPYITYRITDIQNALGLFPNRTALLYYIRRV